MTKKKTKFLYPLVHIEWADATTHNAWIDLSDIQKEVGTYSTTTVGFLMKEDEESYYLASTYHENLCNAQITIPKGMVRSIVYGRFALPIKRIKKEVDGEGHATGKI
jgi:hypothetical protein